MIYMYVDKKKVSSLFNAERLVKTDNRPAESITSPFTNIAHCQK